MLILFNGPQTKSFGKVSDFTIHSFNFTIIFPHTNISLHSVRVASAQP